MEARVFPSGLKPIWMIELGWSVGIVRNVSPLSPSHTTNVRSKLLVTSVLLLGLRATLRVLQNWIYRQLKVSHRNFYGKFLSGQRGVTCQVSLLSSKATVLISKMAESRPFGWDFAHLWGFLPVNGQTRPLFWVQPKSSAGPTGAATGGC